MPSPLHNSAREDFRQARRQAALQQIWANIRGQSSKLLAFDQISQVLEVGEVEEAGIQEIPLDAIIGSVGRYEDYTRSFLPKFDSDEERWVNVRDQIIRAGISPIDVYQVGETYFVKDGNHRVSIARQLGNETILARVTNVSVRVDLKPDDDLDLIIAKARYARFLKITDLDKQRPDSDLSMIVPGHYEHLIEQIKAQQHLLNLDPVKEEVTIKQAAAAWYDRTYLPLTRLINRQGLEDHFPELTETDLYVLVTMHRQEMKKDLNYLVDVVAAADDLALRKSKEPGQVLDRVGGRILDAMTPDAMESGPFTGNWRNKRLSRRPSDTLFPELLVACQGSAIDYDLLVLSSIIAKREQARLILLRVFEDDNLKNKQDLDEERINYKRQCRDLNIRCEYIAEIGSPARMIVDRSTLADLLVVGLARIKNKSEVGFGRKFNMILQRSPRPVLVVPEASSSNMDKAILAYDGSPKSDEALYLAAYAAKNWLLDLIVVAAGKKRSKNATHRAKSYLAMRDIPARYLTSERSAAEAILEAVNDHQRNVIFMGGFGNRPVMQLVVGSTVNSLLQECHHPIFICR
jgi:nucleotide-binding universal stress UspA family protein